MDVARLELCMDLCEASSWVDCYWWHVYDKATIGDAEYQLFDMEDAEKFIKNHPDCAMAPAYDAGFLARKLESANNLKIRKYIIGGTRIQWSAQTRIYIGVDNRIFVEQYADRPEDALCMLVLKMFEHGKFKKW